MSRPHRFHICIGRFEGETESRLGILVLAVLGLISSGRSYVLAFAFDQRP